MRASYTMTLHVEVFDHEQLREAARQRRTLDGVMSREEWEELRGGNLSGVAADLHMLLDPGVSPPGCSIEAGECHFDEGEEPEETAGAETQGEEP